MDERKNKYGEPADWVPTPPARARSPFPEAESSIARLRERAFELAGLTPEVVAEQLRKAVQVYLDGMEATKEEVDTYHGEVIDRRQTVDHATRIKAADSWANLTGVSANKASMGGQGQPGAPQIVLNVPFLQQLEEMKNVTPIEKENGK